MSRPILPGVVPAGEGPLASPAEWAPAETATPPGGWLVDEWGRESFPASDPPARWAGADTVTAAAGLATGE